jgi:glycosyltransferase involved in cell wall biosynthesis
MIVKDEAHVIRRCLQSVRSFVDCWVIVDTGSSDGTQNIILEELRDVPGELYERPWKNFGHNRTEALQLARTHADFIFTIDADEVLELPEAYIRPKLMDDAYLINVQLGGTDYGRVCLISTKLNWKYVGVLHEYLTADGPFERATLPGPVVRCFDMEGGRSIGLTASKKYRRDAAILEDASFIWRRAIVMPAISSAHSKFMRNERQWVAGARRFGTRFYKLLACPKA